MRRAASGTLLSRPDDWPTWRAHMEAQPVVWGRLQSKTDDVKEEMRTFVNHFKNLDKDFKVLFAAGDGLSNNQMDFQLTHDEDSEWNVDPPYLITVLGDLHGLWHVGHSRHRRFRPFCEKAAQKINYLGWVWEPNIQEHFHRLEWFIFILTQACAEYVIEICQVPGAIPYSNSVAFFREAKRNSDFAWVIYFLRDYGFFYIDYKHAVRENNGATLDILWREFLPGAKDVTAHKTKYGPLSIMRIFYATQLHPKLAQIYQFIRTIPHGREPGTRVGHDHVQEWMNKDLKRDVGPGKTEENVNNYCRRYNFWRVVLAGVYALVFSKRDVRKQQMKDMRSSVDVLKRWLRKSIGEDWDTATHPIAESNLGVSDKFPQPWFEDITASNVVDGPASLSHYVKRTIERMAPWFEFKPSPSDD